DKIHGYIPSPILWETNGKLLETVNQVDIAEFENLANQHNTQVIDLRGEAEFNAGHVKDAENIFVGTLPSNIDKVSRDKQLVIHCQAGDRASIGYSILTANG